MSSAAADGFHVVVPDGHRPDVLGGCQASELTQPGQIAVLLNERRDRAGHVGVGDPATGTGYAQNILPLVHGELIEDMATDGCTTAVFRLSVQ